MLDVEAVNVKQRLALWSNGEITHLDKLFDRDGFETEDADDAVAATAPHPRRGWACIDLRAFGVVKVH